MVCVLIVDQTGEVVEQVREFDAGNLAPSPRHRWPGRLPLRFCAP
ncbi:MAG: hypothetical protein ACRDZO_14250 [Egibacteraceae bacterium]